jgi:serine phosphatase RsbU (regulator of sigma subunit)
MRAARRPVSSYSAESVSVGSVRPGSVSALSTRPAMREGGDRVTDEAPPAVRTVLLVEDDPADAFLVSELLAEVDPDLKVLVADTLDAAVGRLPEADCVLLDLNLPGAVELDGLHAVLRAAPSAAVCVLTGLASEYLGTAAVAAGAQDYLVKGTVDGQVLIRSLRFAVERRRAEAGLARLQEERLVAAEAARLERGLLPTPLLAGSGVHPDTFYRPGRTRSLLGGDFYDAVRCPDGHVHAIVGDVCGHGPDEAALGALLRASWRALVLAGVEESRQLPALQQVLVSERHDQRLFTTATTVVIDGDTVTVRIAGHPAPVSLRPHPETIGPPVGLPLGILPGTSWDGTTTTLTPGWALLLHSDGLVEGRGPVPGDLLWPEGLLELLRAEDATPLDVLPVRLVERATALNGGPLLDDVAILILSGEQP